MSLILENKEYVAMLKERLLELKSFTEIQNQSSLCQ